MSWQSRRQQLRLRHPAAWRRAQAALPVMLAILIVLAVIVAFIAVPPAGAQSQDHAAEHESVALVDAAEVVGSAATESESAIGGSQGTPSLLHWCGERPAGLDDG